MTDTSRTDNHINAGAKIKLGGDPLKYARVESEFARKLERENNELVRLGNALCEWCEAQVDQPLQYFCIDQMRTLKQDIKNWRKATE